MATDARERLRDALTQWRGATFSGPSENGYAAEAMARAIEAMLASPPPAGDAVLLRELQEALEAILQRATNRRGMNTQELRGLLWGIEDIAKKGLDQLARAAKKPWFKVTDAPAPKPEPAAGTKADRCKVMIPERDPNAPMRDDFATISQERCDNPRPCPDHDAGTKADETAAPWPAAVEAWLRYAEGPNPPLVGPQADNRAVAAYLRSLPARFADHLFAIRQVQGEVSEWIKRAEASDQHIKRLEKDRDEARAEVERLRALDRQRLDQIGMLQKIIHEDTTPAGIEVKRLTERAEAAERERDDVLLRAGLIQPTDSQMIDRGADIDAAANALLRQRDDLRATAFEQTLNSIVEACDAPEPMFSTDVPAFVRDLRAKLAAAEQRAEQLRGMVGKAELHREKAEGDAQAVRAELRLLEARVAALEARPVPPWSPHDLGGPMMFKTAGTGDAPPDLGR